MSSPSLCAVPTSASLMPADQGGPSPGGVAGSGASPADGIGTGFATLLDAQRDLVAQDGDTAATETDLACLDDEAAPDAPSGTSPDSGDVAAPPSAVPAAATDAPQPSADPEDASEASASSEPGRADLAPGVIVPSLGVPPQPTPMDPVTPDSSLANPADSSSTLVTRGDAPPDHSTVSQHEPAARPGPSRPLLAPATPSGSSAHPAGTAPGSPDGSFRRPTDVVSVKPPDGSIPHPAAAPVAAGATDAITLDDQTPSVDGQPTRPCVFLTPMDPVTPDSPLAHPDDPIVESEDQEPSVNTGEPPTTSTASPNPATTDDDLAQPDDRGSHPVASAIPTSPAGATGGIAPSANLVADVPVDAGVKPASTGAKEHAAAPAEGAAASADTQGSSRSPSSGRLESGPLVQAAKPEHESRKARPASGTGPVPTATGEGVKASQASADRATQLDSRTATVPRPVASGDHGAIDPTVQSQSPRVVPDSQHQTARDVSIDAAVAAARRAVAAALHGASEARGDAASLRGSESALSSLDEAAPAVHHVRQQLAAQRFEAFTDPVAPTPPASDLSAQADARHPGVTAAALQAAFRRAGVGPDEMTSRGFERILQPTTTSLPVPVVPSAGVPTAQPGFLPASVWMDALGMAGQPLSDAPRGYGEAELPQQIVRAIRLQWAQGVSEARVRLQPQHLGDVVVSLRVEHGAVRADLHADSVEVRNMIRGNEAELRRTLGDQGLQLTRLTVDEKPEQRQTPQRERHEGAPQQRRQRPRETGPRFEVLA